MHQVYVIDVLWGLRSESCLEEGQQKSDLHILPQPQDLPKDAGTVVKEELNQVAILAVKELRIDEAVEDREHDLVKDIHPGLKALFAISGQLPAKVRDSDREILLSNLPAAPDERTDIPLPLQLFDFVFKQVPVMFDVGLDRQDDQDIQSSPQHVHVKGLRLVKLPFV